MTVDTAASILSTEATTYDDTVPSITTAVETGTGPPLTTTTVLKLFGADFGGQPLKVTRPDGTVTTYRYLRNEGTGKNVTVKSGAITNPTAADGGTVTHGTTATTTFNAFGTPVLGTSTLIAPDHGSIITESYEVTAVDAFGRAEITSHFGGAYTTRASYSCCGLETSTDMHGVETVFAYDGLRRQTKSTTLGVTTETV